MNPKFSNLQLILYSLGFALLLGALLFVSYYPPKDGAANLTAWLFTALGTLSGHMLGNVQGRGAADGGAPSLPAGQGGFIALPFLALLLPIALLAALLQGCSATPAVAAWESATSQQIKAANDLMVKTWKEGGCAMPAGAVLRDADVTDFVNRNCGNSKVPLISVPAPAASGAKP